MREPSDSGPDSFIDQYARLLDALTASDVEAWHRLARRTLSIGYERTDSEPHVALTLGAQIIASAAKWNCEIEVVIYERHHDR